MKKGIILKWRIKTIDGMEMPFRVDFDNEEEFWEAVEKWNSYFRE